MFLNFINAKIFAINILVEDLPFKKISLLFPEVFFYIKYRLQFYKENNVLFKTLTWSDSSLAHITNSSSTEQQRREKSIHHPELPLLNTQTSNSLILHQTGMSFKRETDHLMWHYSIGCGSRPVGTGAAGKHLRVQRQH